MFIFDELGMCLKSESDRSSFFAETKKTDSPPMNLHQIFSAVTAIVVMVLLAVIVTTSNMEKSADLKFIKSEIAGLHNKMANFEIKMANIVANFEMDVQNKMATIEKKVDSFLTEVKDLRNLFVSSQKGQSAAADSALSIRENGEYVACGTLAYSTRLKEAVVITNTHVVADFNTKCRFEITVRTRGNVDIPISEWYVPQGNVDIAFGRLAHPPPIPALNITLSADVVSGLHIWAFSLQRSGLVALDGRVTSTLKTPYQFRTNVGGMPGFSGTGYVNYAGTLSVVHVGGAPDAVRRRRSARGGAKEVNLAHYSSGCIKGMRLGATGMASHIDSCLDLASDIGAGTPEQAAAAAAAAVATRRRCVEGWSMLAVGKFKEPPPDFVESCASVFSSRLINNETKRACELGWMLDCGEDCDFISACLSFASGEPLGDQEGPATREACRSGWYDKYAEYATACETYVNLRARNPEAEGVAAWLVDDPDFEFVDRSERFPKQCMPQ